MTKLDVNIGDEEYVKRLYDSDLIINLVKDRIKHKDCGLIKVMVNRINPNEDYLYILDTPFNRDKMICAFGEPKFLWDIFTYIQFDKFDLSWRPTFTHEWLYREPPLLTDIEHLILNYKK